MKVVFKVYFDGLVVYCFICSDIILFFIFDGMWVLEVLVLFELFEVVVLLGGGFVRCNILK